MAAVLMWLATIGAGLLLVVVTAALKKLALHAFVCALISVNFVILGLREHERSPTTPAQKLELLTVSMRYTACNWLWMSLALIAMHLRGFNLTGPLAFAFGALLAALAVFAMAHRIQQTAARRPTRTARLLSLAGLTASTQLIGALGTVFVMIWFNIGQGARYDWASLNVIVFSALAVAIINGRALVTLAVGLPVQTQQAAVTQPLELLPARVHG